MHRWDKHASNREWNWRIYSTGFKIILIFFVYLFNSIFIFNSFVININVTYNFCLRHTGEKINPQPKFHINLIVGHCYLKNLKKSIWKGFFTSFFWLVCYSLCPLALYLRLLKLREGKKVYGRYFSPLALVINSFWYSSLIWFRIWLFEVKDNFAAVLSWL